MWRSHPFDRACHELGLDAHNFAKRIKTPNGLTPYEAIRQAWIGTPERFKLAPVHLTSGLNT